MRCVCDKTSGRHSISQPFVSMTDSAAAATFTGTKTVTSALCIIPPVEVWDDIQRLRVDHDHAYPRWPPHINLLYPFIPETEFVLGTRVLQAAFAASPPAPMRITLDVFNAFAKGKTAAIWLHPREDAGTGLETLYKTVESAFPFCASGREQFVPHLSVGQAPKGRAAACIQEFQASWEPVTFEVDHVCLISRVDDKPFETKSIVRFFDT